MIGIIIVVLVYVTAFAAGFSLPWAWESQRRWTFLGLACVALSDLIFGTWYIVHWIHQ